MYAFIPIESLVFKYINKYVPKIVTKRYCGKFGIKYATFSFFNLTIIFIFVPKLILYKAYNTKEQAILLVRRYKLREHGCIFNF